MDIEIEVNRLVSDNDECPHCNGSGKLNVPGAPDCPSCKGMGVIKLLLHCYPNKEAKVDGQSQNLQ